MKYYTLFELINGLRPSYKELNSDLKKLKKFIRLPKNYIDINFYQYNINRGVIDYVLEGTLFDNIKNIFIDNPYNGKVYKKYSNYIFTHDNIRLNNKYFFNKFVREILESDFVNNITYERRKNLKRLKITPSIIEFSIERESGSIVFIYDCINDKYIYNQFDCEFTMPDMLGMLIDKDELSQFHVDTIEKNKSLILK